MWGGLTEQQRRRLAAPRRLSSAVPASGGAPRLARRPMSIDTTPVYALAPLRISFVGGGTDFPHYYGEHGGAVLSTTIDHFVRVTVTPRDDRQVRVRSLDLGHLVEYHLDEGPEYDGVMDLAKAAIDRIGIDVGLDMDIESEAPPGSGLGGSSALVTAVVAALAASATAT